MRLLAENQDVAALHKMPTGVEGFDAITGGGVPGIFVAFEENSRQILINAASFGWKLPELEKKQLLFIDAKMRPDVIKAGEFDLSGMLAGIKAEAGARGARRIVFDAVDVLLSLLDDRFAGRRGGSRLGERVS